MPIITQTTQQTTQKALSVSDLNRDVRLLLEENIGVVEVKGEISNLMKAQSGHYYFKLKDAKAQVQCAFFKFKANRCKVKLENGIEVIATASVSLYEPRGDYQLIIEAVEPFGVGQLQKQFEQLKEKLHKAGLFEQQHKKPIPTLPKTIGIITSEKAAALRDVLTTLERRFPLIEIIIYPSDVQGDKASAKLTKQIERANQHACCDVLLLTRGGGSMEDLFAFNDERLAYAIYHSDIPIISGVGHEIDFTIADFCADLRAPTPTAAAEHASPNMDDYLEELHGHFLYLSQLIKTQRQFHTQALNHLQQRLKSPKNVLLKHYQTLDNLQDRIQFSIKAKLHQSEQQLTKLQTRLIVHNPNTKLGRRQHQLAILKANLIQQMTNRLHEEKLRLTRLGALLQATSPLATLDRGYALAIDKHNKVITHANALAIGDEFKVKLKQGTLIAELKDKS